MGGRCRARGRGQGTGDGGGGGGREAGAQPRAAQPPPLPCPLLCPAATSRRTPKCLLHAPSFLHPGLCLPRPPAPHVPGGWKEALRGQAPPLGGAGRDRDPSAPLPGWGQELEYLRSADPLSPRPSDPPAPPRASPPAKARGWGVGGLDFHCVHAGGPAPEHPTPPSAVPGARPARPYKHPLGRFSRKCRTWAEGRLALARGGAQTQRDKRPLKSSLLPVPLPPSPAPLPPCPPVPPAPLSPGPTPVPPASCPPAPCSPCPPAPCRPTPLPRAGRHAAS